MSSNSDTSMWQKFFTEAGIPAGDAINYAIIFTDNRIKLHMLMDLNKEYLRDMGITVMGDVIAILKHAKVFCGRQRVLQASQSTPQYDGCAPPPKKSTPATRMLEHYVQKEDPPPPAPPPSGSPNLSQSMSARLGSGLKRSAEDDDSPSANKRSSVLNRLGDNSVTSTTSDTPKITITMRGKHIKRTVAAMDSNKKSPTSVFGRLGNKDNGANRGSGDREPSPGKPLEYELILKHSSKENFEKNLAAKKKSLAAVATMNADTTTCIKSRLGLQSSSTGDLTKETEEANQMKSGKPSSSASVRLTVGKKFLPAGQTLGTAVATSSSSPLTGKKKGNIKGPTYTKEQKRRLFEMVSEQRELDRIYGPPLPINRGEKRYNKIFYLKGKTTQQNMLSGSKENVTTGSPGISAKVEEEGNHEAI